jgi:pimeloyl-ACP methyl ester carboxylesterase
MSLFRYPPFPLHYLVRGRGEPLLLVHGLGASGADWAYQVRALEGQAQLIVPDLPGCGHSGAPVAGYSIEGLATALWALLDHLGLREVNIMGFSLGGAVALEMALQRPAAVPRLVLINSLTSYRIDHWTKWLEARVPAAMVTLLGMRLTGRLCAARLFPHAWQRPLRERAAAVIGNVAPASYLGLMQALEHWDARDRLTALRSRILVIAAEFDYTPLGEKRALAASLGAELVVVRGSRHCTPFDATTATNALLAAVLRDAPLPDPRERVCDAPGLRHELGFDGSLAAQHALGPGA